MLLQAEAVAEAVVAVGGAGVLRAEEGEQLSRRDVVDKGEEHPAARRGEGRGVVAAVLWRAGGRVPLCPGAGVAEQCRSRRVSIKVVVEVEVEGEVVGWERAGVSGSGRAVW